jgi:hypothetical protein
MLMGGRLNIIKMSALLKLILKSNAISLIIDLKIYLKPK